MMIARETFVSVPGGELFCREVGEGMPVLLVHGFPISGAMWLGVAESLSDRWRCIVPDLRGHGRSFISDSASIGVAGTF